MGETVSLNIKDPLGPFWIRLSTANPVKAYVKKNENIWILMPPEIMNDGVFLSHGIRLNASARKQIRNGGLARRAVTDQGDAMRGHATNPAKES